MDPSHTRSSRKRSRPRDSPSPRRTPLVPEETGRPSRSSYTAQQTSLPSIRQLHPYLPPSSNMSQHAPGAGEGSSYSYPPPQQQPGYAVGMHHESPQQQTTSDRSRGRGDSDAEGEGEPGPPKKKRRRQALSCTGALELFDHVSRSNEYHLSSSKHVLSSAHPHPCCYSCHSVTNPTMLQNVNEERLNVTGSCPRSISALVICAYFPQPQPSIRAQPCGPCSRRGEQTKCQWHIVEPMYVQPRPITLS